MVRMVKMLRCPTSSTSFVSNWIILSAVLCALVNTIGCFKLLLLLFLRIRMLFRHYVINDCRGNLYNIDHPIVDQDVLIEVLILSATVLHILRFSHIYSGSHMWYTGSNGS